MDLQVIIMNEFDYLYGDEFFIISSDNLNDIDSKFYGFAITDEGIIFDNPNIEKLDGTGCYVYIIKENDKILIYQDFCGCYGLFVYQNNDYFAISNSFIKLVDFLKDKVVINLNLDYAYTFISASPCSTVYKETLIKEIQVLPHNYVVNIDITSNHLNFLKIDYYEKTVSLTSKESIIILDKWYHKWINLFNFLYKNTSNLEFSLSGGFDSRVILTLLLSSEVDLNDINILAFISEKPTFKEDFEIASEIAKDFGFELNKFSDNIKKYYFNDLATSINLSYYLRGGFAKQMYWKNFIYSEKKYHIRGLGGELLRNFYTDQSINMYITNQAFIAHNYSIESSKSTKRILEKTFEEYSKIHETFTEHELLNMQYLHTRNRFYSGTQISEDYLTNNVMLNPLMDPLLNKIHVDAEDEELRYLLPCLIFLRYFPEVLNYKFQGNREINEKTMETAKSINNMYPFEDKWDASMSFDFDSKINFDFTCLSEVKKIDDNDQYNFLKEKFSSNNFKEMFSMFLPYQIYEKVYNDEMKLFPDSPYSDLNAVIIVMKIVEDVMFSHLKKGRTPFDWLEGIQNYQFNVVKKVHNEKNIDDVRIDLKNHGNKDNDVIILDISDYNAWLLKPDWFTNSNGIGLTIESSECPLNIKLKCINDGELYIGLKSRDVWDENKKRIPILFNKVLINSEIIFDDAKVASHDDPILLKRKVKHDEIIDIQVNWKLV